MTDSASTSADDAADPLIGKVLQGRYRIHQLLDRGGMARVYRAEQLPLGRTVALKTMDVADIDGEFKQRFFNEAACASKLDHPNTVRIFDYGHTEDGVYYISMELLRGATLRDAMAAGPMPPNRVINIARQIAGALHEAHGQNMIHRDLKPGNVFLTQHGDDHDFVKVLDFGLVKQMEAESKVSRTGIVLGSPLYMAPEQIEGEDVDGRTDVYALGSMLYAMLMGDVPYRRGNLVALMNQQLFKVPPTFKEFRPNLTVPESLEWVVRACIEKAPADRIGSMAELSRALRLCQLEARGELQLPIPWKLTPDGRLDLPEVLLAEVSNVTRSMPTSRAPGEASTSTSHHTLARPAAGSVTTSSMTMTRGTKVAAAAGVSAAMLLGVGALGALLLVAGVLVYLQWPASPALATDPPPASAGQPSVEDTPRAKKTREIVVSTTPAGAELLLEGVVLGTSPVRLTVPTDADWVIDVRLAGHEPRQLRLNANTDDVAVALTALAPAPTPVSLSPKPRPAPVATPTPAAAPAPATAPKPANVEAPAPAPTFKRPEEIKNPFAR